jgi:hypothetical protein
VWSRERALFEDLDADISEFRREQTEADTLRDESQASSLSYLASRLDALERQVRETAALGWDHAALVRRIAALEDRLGSQASEDAEVDAPGR